MTPKEWRRAQAELRVAHALRQIQLAQDCLDRAFAELSALRWGHPQQRRIAGLREKLHAEWYRTRRLTENPRLELDRDPTPEELR